MYHLEGKINEIIMTFRCRCCIFCLSFSGAHEENEEKRVKRMNCKLTSKLFLAPQMNCLFSENEK